ncbi:hypothetical protein DOK67_0000967 [Enterococcus sp. DIV0212c]|uniref:hypothetical protein n=1 Tax=Enterococcus sp. DIV0212c TaxID=2230867 RepID=UPI001A9B8245|nr:hypothetical protein [Enterococcus sp. DIV0212c]MBO1352666.1 hypothetical protein [Enterococcus sp. DIV0212c]
MKKILFKASTLLFLVSLVYPTCASALELPEVTFMDFDVSLQEPNHLGKITTDELSSSSEIVDDNLAVNEPLNVVVDAKAACLVEKGTVIDEVFIKEKVIDQIIISGTEIAKDQIDIAISSQLFSTADEQLITYSLSGKFTRGLLISEDFSVQRDLKVTFEDAKLTAKPNPVTTTLGTMDNEYDLYTFVKDVKLGAQNVIEDDYSVLLKDTVPTDTTGQKKVNVQVILNADKSKMTEVQVPVNVRWGNSIAISGEWTGTDARRIVSVLTLQKGPSLSLEPGQGASSLDFGSLPTFDSPVFSTVSFYHADDLGTLNLNLSPNRQFSLKSKDTPIQIKEAWNLEIGARENIAIGDIIQVWHGRKTGEKYERAWLYYVGNENFLDETSSLNDVYYEVTEEGLKLIQLNTFSTTEISVPIYTNESYLDEHIDEMIDSKGLSTISKKFIFYPDTTSFGKKEAIIRVEQTIGSGKKVQYDYPVTVIVEEGELNLSVPQALTFDDFTLCSQKQLVGTNNEKNNLLGLTIEDSRGAGVQGNYALSLVMDDDSLLSQYVVYKDANDDQEQFLNHSAIPIFNSTLEDNPNAPSETAPLRTWDSKKGLFLSIPADEPLKAQTYTGTLKWTLTAGP